jgi:hypothetical protein
MLDSPQILRYLSSCLRLRVGKVVDVSSDCEVSMDEADDRRSFATGGCDAFCRSSAGISDGEHAGY